MSNQPFTISYSTNQFRNSVLESNTNTQNDQIEMLRDGISNTFQENVYYKAVNRNFDETQTFDIWIYDGNVDEKKIKKFTSYPYSTVQFKSGDYISYTDRSGNYQVWMIVTLDQTNEWEVSGEIRQCVHLLKWQNKAGTILSRWCVMDKSTSIGLDITQAVRQIDSMYTIKLTFDSETKLLREDKRFLIDVSGVEVPNAYKVTERNVMTQNYGENGNVVTLTVIKDPFRENGIDNATLMIADYFIPEDSPVQPGEGDTNYSIITCSNSSNLITVGGTYRTLSVVFYDNKDTINNSITASWTYNLPSGLEDKVVITPIIGTNNVKIKVLDDTRLLGKTITANVSDGHSAYQSSIVLDIIMG